MLLRCIGERSGPSRSRRPKLPGQVQPDPTIHFVGFPLSKRSLAAKTRDGGNGASMATQKTCLTVDHCPWPGLSELGAAATITAVAQRSSDLCHDSQMGKRGALENTHSFGFRDSMAQCWVSPPQHCSYFGVRSLILRYWGCVWGGCSAAPLVLSTRGQ